MDKKDKQWERREGESERVRERERDRKRGRERDPGGTKHFLIIENCLNQQKVYIW